MTLRLLLPALCLLPATGCHWLAGNPDATLNGATLWRDAAPAAVTTESDEQRVAWVRVRPGGTDPSTVRVLSDRVRRLLREEGWRIDEDRSDAGVCVDLEVRFFGVNPVQDEAGSTYAKLLRDRRPDLLGEGESARGGRFTTIGMLRPESVISSLVANLVEYDLIVDVHLRRRVGGPREEKQTVVVWVRKIDLEAEEAAAAAGDRVLAALRDVFQRR